MGDDDGVGCGGAGARGWTAAAARPAAGGARAAAAHVFVPDLEGPALDEADRHHLGRVLRLRSGEAVSASDGRGGWRPCRWDGAALSPDGPIERSPSPQPAVTVAFAVPKGDRAEWAVQKLAEVGADRIIPLLADRSVVRWDAERGDRHTARWAAVARQAAMQSRRLWLPRVEGPCAVSDIAGPGAALAEPGGAPPTLRHPTALIGPEGGWSERELASGLPTVGLGPTVLRTETAAVVAAALLVALRAGSVAAAGEPDESGYRTVT
ncbi:MAG TPA: 16S rRNA (uracil(1498)-N(3))-methyltransferase [Acidimicrobiales bacterium]|nr:16S rRNA (uracil(1498)-N(3))-methyltransferase [Acidimicrobiales bacterium]